MFLLLTENLEKNPHEKIKLKYVKKVKHKKHAIVEINNTCNLNCAMCQTMLTTRKRGRMEMDLLRKVLDKLSKKVKLSFHTLGDPLANPRLAEIFKEIRRYNFKTLYVPIAFCLKGMLILLLD